MLSAAGTKHHHASLHVSPICQVLESLTIRLLHTLDWISPDHCTSKKPAEVHKLVTLTPWRFPPSKAGENPVVFDAAALHDGESLNGQLIRGPDLTNSLFGVLLRFRQERIVLVADIQSMFLQVKVPPEDADALRFLWWEDDDLSKPPKEYQMVRHWYWYQYCIKRTAEDNKEDFTKEAVKSVQEDFYVDDLLKAVETPSKAISLVHELMTLLEKGGFRLTKWTSSCREVLANIPRFG